MGVGWRDLCASTLPTQIRGAHAKCLDDCDRPLRASHVRDTVDALWEAVFHGSLHYAALPVLFDFSFT